MPAPHTAPDIAKWFINATDRESGDSITHLKVQKLVYYAQGWALALMDEPLFDEDLMAWTHGPVSRSVWDRFKGSGFDALAPQRLTAKLPRATNLLLEAVNAKYSVFSAKQLERMTHKEEPWLLARGGIPLESRSETPISKESMKAYFKGLSERGKKRK